MEQKTEVDVKELEETLNEYYLKLEKEIVDKLERHSVFTLGVTAAYHQVLGTEPNEDPRHEGVIRLMKNAFGEDVFERK